MNCNYIRQHILDFLDSSLDEIEVAEFEKHIQHCETCSKLVVNFRIAFSAYNEEPQLEAGPYYYSKLKNRLEKRQANKNTQWIFFSVSTSLLKPAYAVVIIILALFTGIFLGIHEGTKDVRQIRLEEYAEYHNFHEANQISFYDEFAEEE